MKKSWVGIEISCGEDVADDLAAEVADTFQVGVEIGERCVRFYLEGDHFLEEWKQELDRILSEAARIYRTGEPFPFKTFVLSDEGWADSWKVHFKPLRVGKHLVIRPTWEEYGPRPGDRVIVMDPGRAFGTGHHETTRLCLEWLERWAEERDVSASSLLDVGTGAGVLAMAGAGLGFGEILGIDNDPEAIEVAGENIGLNDLEDRVTLQEATISGIAGRFDVVIANIQALPLIRMAQELGARVKTGGRLVLSGILVEQQQDVAAAYERCGLHPMEKEVAGEWILMVFEKGRKGAQP